MNSTKNKNISNIGCGLYLYFLDDLSVMNVIKVLSFLHIIKRSHHVAIWNWIQKYRPKEPQEERKRFQYIAYETLIKAGSEFVWLWVAIEPENMEIVASSISQERNMFIAIERFLSGIVWDYDTSCFNRR